MSGDCTKEQMWQNTICSHANIGELFDPGKTNMVEGNIESTNASDSGLGAVLLQKYDGVNMSVMYMYISRSLNGAETRYSTIERECVALFWATKRLQVYLYGTGFILGIDYQPLAFVNRANINNDRVMHPVTLSWHLQMYRYQVHIVKGRKC